MPEGLSNVAYGARQGVSEASVRKWTRSGFVIRFADGSINPEATDRKLAGSLDPARTKLKPARTFEPAPVPGSRIALAGPLSCIEELEEPYHRGVALAALALIRSVPASAAIFAIEAGAPVRTAFVLRRMMIALLAVSAADLLDQLGADTEKLRIEIDWIDEVDWPAKCSDTGEPCDPDAWTAHLAEVNRRLESLPN